MQTAKLKLPKILDIPPKLYPVLLELNQHPLFLIEGGRGSGKTHTIGRIILYLGEQRKIRVADKIQKFAESRKK